LTGNKFDNIKFGTDGWRGIIGFDFNLSNLSRVVVAACQELHYQYYKEVNSKKIIIGYDRRFMACEFAKQIVPFVRGCGFDAILSDSFVTTPSCSFYAKEVGCLGALVITASHNPSEYNGLKFLQSDGTFLSPEQCEELFKAVDQNVSIVQPDSLGVVSDYSTANEEHIEKVLAAMCIDTDNIRKNKFKVVIDCVNGAGSFILPMLCEKLGCEVITINCKSKL